MNDRLTARLRTVWPLLLGHAATALAMLITRQTGITVDSAVLFVLVSLAASYAAWEAGTWLTRRPNPIGQRIGRWLVSAGAQTGEPTYPTTPGGAR